MSDPKTLISRQNLLLAAEFLQTQLKTPGITQYDSKFITEHVQELLARDIPAPKVPAEYVVRVNIVPTIEMNLRNHVSSVKSVWVKIPSDLVNVADNGDDPPVISIAKPFAADGFVAERIKAAATITYLADFEHLREATHNHFTWDAYLPRITSVPSEGVYATLDEAIAYGLTIVPTTLHAVYQHDEYLGQHPTIKCSLVRTVVENGETIERDLGKVLYNSEVGMVYSDVPHDGNYFLQLPDDRRVPIYTGANTVSHPYGFQFST